MGPDRFSRRRRPSASPPRCRSRSSCQNYVANDHHADPFETDYFNALFAALPNKTAIVSDGSRLNMMVLYKLLAEDAGVMRDIHLVSPDAKGVEQLSGKG